MTDFYIGVDVGTGSVRAALVTCAGHVTRVEVRDISRVSPGPGQYVQSSREIWAAVCSCVRSLTQGHVDPTRVKGLGFAATCSLVIETRDTCGPELCGEPGYDVIMWMDHRAKVTCFALQHNSRGHLSETNVQHEAEKINSTCHRVLDYVGGGVSLEMQMPKLLWLKTHRPDLWTEARRFFDLPDWLVARASDEDARSLCSVVCKE